MTFVLPNNPTPRPATLAGTMPGGSLGLASSWGLMGMWGWRGTAGQSDVRQEAARQDDAQWGSPVESGENKKSVLAEHMYPDGARP